MISIKRYYESRFGDLENKSRFIVWQTLCDVWFNKYIKRSDTVMDIGAGYCEFLNNINCRRKIAIDINPDTKKMAGKDIEVLNIDFFAMPPKLNNNVDVILISNFLEHLSSKNDVIKALRITRKLLKKSGKLLILQPNIDLVKESYWDFIDHIIPLNSNSLKEALAITGFEIKEFVERFLPYTSKTKFMLKKSFFVKLYLKLPTFFRPFAGQSFILASKNNQNFNDY